MPADDLLSDYADTGDEGAFGRIAERYSGLVYSSALRRTGSKEAAEEMSPFNLGELEDSPTPIAFAR